MNDARIWLMGGIAGAMLLSACATYHLDPTSASTLDDRLQALSTSEYGHSRAPTMELREFLSGHQTSAQRRAIERHLSAFAADPSATRAARQHVIRELGRLGAGSSAPVLIHLLSDDELGDDAAMALQRMTDSRVRRQVLAALPSTQGIGRERALILLGIPGYSDAVPALADDARDPDARIASAAITSLGRVATAKAAGGLIDVLPQLNGAPRAAAWPALLSCQEAAMSESDDRTLRAVTTALEQASPPAHVLAASKRAVLQTASPRDTELGISELLRSADPTVQSVGAELARQQLPDDLLLSVSRSLPPYPPASQIALLGILEERELSAAAPLIAEQASSPDPAVQAAAIRALGRAGDAAIVAVVARATVAESEAVREAAAASLRTITGPRVDAALHELARTADGEIRVEVLAALGDRGMTDALPVVFEAAIDPDPAVRRAAIREVGALAGSDAWPRVLAALDAVEETEDLQAWIRAAGAAGTRIPGSGSMVASALAATPRVQTRVALLTLAGHLGDNAVLPELARGASDSNPDIRNSALRALGSWDSLASLPALLAVASETGETSHRLAVRGALEVIRRADGTTNAQRIAHYREVAPGIDHLDDRRLLLSSIAELPDPAALALAAEFLDDGDVRAEAEAAVLRIAKQIEAPDAVVQSALQRIASASDSETMRTEAATLLNR